MPELNTLTATIERKWLAHILDGSKKIEYRTAGKYWMTRLDRVGLPPFKLRLINGMRPDAPEATILVEQVDIDLLNGEIRLHLGEVLETLRWNPDWRAKYPPLEPEPSFDPADLVNKSFADSKIRLEVPLDVLKALQPGKPLTFALPLTNDTYAQFAAAPEGDLAVWLEANSELRKAGLISAFDRYSEDIVDYTIVAFMA